MSTITLMTDFGLKDGNVGVMKGVINSLSPSTQIIDISHLISPQNIAEAALILTRSAPYFACGTIHVVVIDPGVGTKRRPMAARIGNQFYVGPDNGILSMWLEQVELTNQDVSFYQLDQPQYWLPIISHVFHGRDIFAPVAAHLANGLSLEQLGTPFHDPVRLSLPHPERTTAGWRGQVIHVDHFGNLSTNIRREELETARLLEVQIGETTVVEVVKTFGDRKPGTLVALLGSTGNLIISVVNGSAAEHTGAQVGDTVEAIMQ